MAIGILTSGGDCAGMNPAIKHFVDYCLNKAIEAYSKVVELDPSLLDSWFELGRNYALDYNFIEANNCYKKSLENRPDAETIWYKIALECIDKKIFNGAAIYLRNAVDINPLNIDFLDKITFCYEK